MSLPPNPPPGQGAPDSWYPTSANGTNPSFSSGVPSQQDPYGSSYAAPFGNHATHDGVPSSNQYGMLPGQQPPPPQPSDSGGGIIKWLVIGCLGCAGIAVLGFLAMIVLAIIDGPSDGEGADASPTSSIESDASDAGGDGSADSASPATDDTTSNDGDDAAAADPSGAVGETDTVLVTVVSTERTQELSDSLWEYTTDNEYFVINISYANTSSKAVDLWASDVVLVDVEGNEYEANIDVSLAVADPIIIEEVNPGLTLTGTLVYEVPPGTEFIELRFEDSYGSGEEVTISFE